MPLAKRGALRPRVLKGASIYLREKIELQQEKEYERKYITASMTGEQDAERLI